MAFLIATLACWRVVMLFMYEDGPFDVFIKLRSFIGIREWEELTTQEKVEYVNTYAEEPMLVYPNTFFGKLFECVWCFSIWVATIIALYMTLNGLITYAEFPIYALAISGLTIFINKWSE